MYPRAPSRAIKRKNSTVYTHNTAALSAERNQMSDAILLHTYFIIPFDRTPKYPNNTNMCACTFIYVCVLVFLLYLVIPKFLQQYRTCGLNISNGVIEPWTKEKRMGAC